ncbi:MAG: tetratricopeptide repeat protein [Phycisphaerae bacterium]|jgi:tetratricopeptide (TPR) repeat protein
MTTTLELHAGPCPLPFSIALPAAAWFARACAADRAGAAVEAATCYRHALEQDPEHVSAHYNLGLLLRREGALDEAEACFQAALEIEPTHHKCLMMWGSICAARGDWEQAKELTLAAHELAPEYVKTIQNLIAIHRHLGETGLAARMQRVLDRVLGQPDARPARRTARHLSGRLH